MFMSTPSLNYFSFAHARSIGYLSGWVIFTRKSCNKPGGGGTPLCDLNGDVRPDRVWFSGCFVLNGVSISLLSVLNRVSLHYLKA